MTDSPESPHQLLARFRALLNEEDYAGLLQMDLDCEEMFDAVWATLMDAGENPAEIFCNLGLIE